jgi:hypothetical protein
MTTRPLTRHEMALLVVASRLTTWTAAAAPVRVYEALGLGQLAFQRQLAAVLRLPAAEAFDPITVRRLRRLSGRGRRGRPAEEPTP